MPDAEKVLKEAKEPKFQLSHTNSEVVRRGLVDELVELLEAALSREKKSKGLSSRSAMP